MNLVLIIKLLIVKLVLDISDIGLVIIDEAHYNSFTKLFKFFDKSFVLGVTATPLSSNMKLPMKDNYDELITGESINMLIENEYLAKASIYSYNVGLTSLEIGANGDYTVKSSEDLYTNSDMLSKLLQAYEERAKGTKTLIFNNGINTSLHVYDTFKAAGYPIAHLDNTNTRKERDFILKWFNKTPNAIITSVSILTTGFDEPSVKSIILNRATKSYLLTDEEIEDDFRYELPKDVRKEFAKTADENLYFDVKKVYIDAIQAGESSKKVLERSIEHHARMCTENSEDLFDALILAKKLGGDIDDRIFRYSKCICKSTHNFIDWLQDDYRKKLNSHLRNNFDEIYEDIFGHPPPEE